MSIIKKTLPSLTTLTKKLLSAVSLKEKYGGRGVASQLMHEFMESIEREKMIADYEEKVEPFYDQLECKVTEIWT